jgi:uncharacterized delta-60 repeat protein
VVAASVGALLVLTGLPAWAAPGDPDTTFSGDGYQLIDLPGHHNDYGQAIALQANGRIVLGGDTRTDGSQSDFGLVRLMSNGTLDSSFSGDGSKAIDVSGVDSQDEVYDIAIQPDGKIVAVGYAEDATGDTSRFAVIRLKPNGTLDTSFSGDGMAYVAFPGRDYAYGYSVAIQEDGKILIGGEAGDESPATNWDFAVARLKSGGALDPTFSGDGRVLTDFEGHYDGIWDMVLQPDGKIVTGGWANNPTGENYKSGIARYKTGGGLDTSFSGDGKLVVDIDASGDDYIEGIEVRGDDKIVAASFVYAGNNPEVGLIRVKTGGGLDTTFSGDGKLRSDPLGANTVFVRDLQLGDGNDLIVAAAAPNQAFVARYTPGGSLDTSFGGGDGFVLITIPGTTSNSAQRLETQPNGKILLVGNAIGDTTDFAVTRLLP